MPLLVRLTKKLRRMQIEAMAKNAKKRGKSVRNGNRASPYNKYGKQAFQYSSDYHKNYLDNGVLKRDGKIVHFKQTAEHNTVLEAAE